MGVLQHLSLYFPISDRLGFVKVREAGLDRQESVDAWGNTRVIVLYTENVADCCKQNPK